MSKSSGITGGDVLLIGGVGLGAIFLLRSLNRPAAAAPAAPSGGGGGILDSIFGALTGAVSSVTGAAQSTASQASPIDPSQIPAGAAASVGGAVSSFLDSIMGGGSAVRSAASSAHEAAHTGGLGSLGGTVFDNPTLPTDRGRVIPPGMTGRVPGRRPRTYGLAAAPMTASRGRTLPPGMTGRPPGRRARRYG
jgi:hypothetical protein